VKQLHYFQYEFTNTGDVKKKVYTFQEILSVYYVYTYFLAPSVHCYRLWLSIVVGKMQLQYCQYVFTYTGNVKKNVYTFQNMLSMYYVYTYFLAPSVHCYCLWLSILVGKMQYISVRVTQCSALTVPDPQSFTFISIV